MSTIFDKWNESIDIDGLKKDIEEAKENGGTGEFKEVPVGKYECSIEKMELKETKKGDPMVSVWFKILEGEYKNSRMFMNQVITQGFQIHIVNEFLRSLGIENVEFKDYGQYNDFLMDAVEHIDGSFEYLIEYSKTKNDFAVYKVVEVYELD